MNIYDIEVVIRKAAKERKTVEIIYLKSSDGLAPREVEPYEIRGDEDFFGYDVKKQGIRRFKLDEIMTANVTKKQYTPRWELKM